MISYITKTVRSVPPAHRSPYWLLIGFWIFSIGYAYYHCAVLGRSFLEPPAMHVIMGGIAFAITLALYILIWRGR